MISFVTKSFQELSTQELYEILHLRAEVFVVEQNCAYQDIDMKDLSCFHVLGYDKGKLAAYARLLLPEPQQEGSIGRVVTSPDFRGLGYGTLLMQYCITEAKRHFETDNFIISAQQYLEKFYTELGFVTEGAMYPEDGIPHIKMRYSQSNTANS